MAGENEMQSGRRPAPRTVMYWLMALVPFLVSGFVRQVPAMAGRDAAFWQGIVVGLALLVGVAGLVLMVRTTRGAS